METKKTKIIGIVSLVALALTVIVATYAYYQDQYGDPAAVDISINANTVDTLTFATGNPISINLNQDNFATGKGNQTSTTTATATLTANSKTNKATKHYYLYLDISENTYTYSIDEDTPEIILTVTDSSGNEVTDISGLNHVNANGVSGYDITTLNGFIALFAYRELTTTSSIEEKWTIKITFINYAQDQSGNAGKSMNARVIIQKNSKTLNDICESGQNLSSCIIAMNGIDKTLYYHDSSLTNGAGDNSYRYAGASDEVNNYVCFGSDADTCPEDNLYRIIGVFSKTENDETINQVKLIKADYATSALLGTDGDFGYNNTPNLSYYKGSLSSISYYYWNKKATTNSGKNTWSVSLLNKTNLNTNYINNIGSTWSAKIATTTWKVGGNTYSNIASKIPATTYANEITNAVTTNTTDSATEYSAKIGLMYVSDYGFAADSSAWATKMDSYGSYNSVNWMYMGEWEWTISRDSDASTNAFVVVVYGYVNSRAVESSYRGVRPVFYLESSEIYSGGVGTLDNPIKLG